MAENAQKTKRKFNGFDLFLIVVVLAVLGAAFYLVVLPRLNHTTSSNGNDSAVAVRYVLRCKSVPNEMQFNISEGDSVVEIIKSTKIGQVVSSKIETATFVGENSKGEFVTSDAKDSKTVYLTVESEATKTETGYILGGEKLLRINEGITVRTPEFCGFCVCIGIEEITDDGEGND